MEFPPSSENHHLISSTAKLVAHLRAESDIPYSAEIDAFCEAGNVKEEIFGEDRDMSWMSVTLELRYKALSGALQKEMNERGISRVLELAAGVQPRGLLMSQDPKVIYIETDLPEMVGEKKKLLQHLDSSDETRPNHKVKPLNVLDMDAFSRMDIFLGEGSVAIINEGLLTYLSVEEKEILARNIHDYLGKHGGVWITPDLSNGDRMRRIAEIFPDSAETGKRLSEAVGRNIQTNSVGGGLNGAIQFYSDLGFKIKTLRSIDFVEHLTALDKIDDTVSDEFLDVLADASVWVLEVDK